MITTIILGIIGLVVILTIFYYNKFVTLKKRVENAWAQIDVQLKRRADLIPNLVNSVKGYAKFEKKVLTEVTKARTEILSARTPMKKAEANNKLEGALKTIFAVAEAYPSLKSNENFKQLQEELSSTENKVAYARQFYNDIVTTYNTQIVVFPGMLFAGILNMKEKELFQTSNEERKNVKVDFSDL